MKSIDEDKHENTIHRITEYYTKSYTITKFRHAHVITLILVNMCVLPHEKKISLNPSNQKEHSWEKINARHS